MKWRAALFYRKFEARLVVKRLEGLKVEKDGRLRAEIKWKGSKFIAGLSSFKCVKRNKTSDGVYDDDDGVLCWNEEFRNFCSFVGFKDSGFCSWEVVVTVINVSSQESKNKGTVVGKASLNLSEYLVSGQVHDVNISVPLTLKGTTGSSPSLMMSISLLEVKCVQDAVDHSCESVATTSASSPSDSALSPENPGVYVPRIGRKKVNLFTGCEGTPRQEISKIENENSSDGKFSNESYVDYDEDSIESLHEEGFADETNLLQPLSYGPLTYVNIGHSISTSDVDDWLYYSNDTTIHVENSATSAKDPSLPLIPKRKFLSWRKRKPRFKSSRSKDEPLLKKDCLDEGGDDIDFDRRQLTSSDDSSYGWYKTEDGSIASGSSFSEFEDEGFCIGSWEQKDITCRDGHMKLETQVFFASMDQRSERAAGESACTALVAVMAEWLQRNRCEMPVKSEFDRLIRDGSSEWRNMCENQAYMERFPDKHFDLETVLKAKIRPLSINPEKSFIGFFHPEGIVEENCFDMLRGSMSFDEIWDEISHQASEISTSSNSLVYIVSWNDHFFILKVEQDAYYIIDTLGERLYEGCSQAYILKFNHDTKIKQVPYDNSPQVSKKEKLETNLEDTLVSNEKSVFKKIQVYPDEASMSKADADGGLVSVFDGKELCKEYIKSFLTAVPIRQLQEDVKKGMTSISLHQRLQIEFHFTDIM